MWPRIVSCLPIDVIPMSSRHDLSIIGSALPEISASWKSFDSSSYSGWTSRSHEATCSGFHSDSDWKSGRLSSKDELLVVILQNFFPFADLKNYMQLQVLQAWRGCSEKRASLSWIEVMRSTNPSLCTRLPRNLWSRSQTFARLNNEHGGLGMSFLQIVAVLFFLVYLFFALCLKQTFLN